MGNLVCYAVVTPGLERLAADELNELAAHDVKTAAGGVVFTTSMDGLFRINLRSRICTRILLRLASFRALSFPELYNRSRKIAWEAYIGPHNSISVRAACSGSKLMHSGRAQQALADAIGDRLGFKPDHATAEQECEQQILLRIDNNQCTISLDSSGERLDRRGYRLHAGRAPLRETIAAAILRWAAWQRDEPLVCPMCGSGTFAMEAAWLATKRAPGLDHLFPFASWPSLKEKRWQRARAKAASMQQGGVRPCIVASELDAAILAQAKENAATAGVGDMTCFEQRDVRTLTAPKQCETAGLMVCNPPYGKRIKGGVLSLYAALGRQFREQFEGWRMVVIAPDGQCEKALGLKVKKQLKFRHGGSWVRALYIEQQD